MAAKSFKQMIKDGDLKRADAMKARLEDLHEEPGFNLRAEGEDLEQSIADLADYLHQGGITPCASTPRDAHRQTIAPPSADPCSQGINHARNHQLRRMDRPPGPRPCSP
ncbi:hypothetical protein ACM7MB_31190 [Pseudomonas aeruginosa]